MFRILAAIFGAVFDVHKNTVKPMTDKMVDSASQAVKDKMNRNPGAAEALRRWQRIKPWLYFFAFCIAIGMVFVGCMMNQAGIK